MVTQTMNWQVMMMSCALVDRSLLLQPLQLPPLPLRSTKRVGDVDETIDDVMNVHVHCYWW